MEQLIKLVTAFAAARLRDDYGATGGGTPLNPHRNTTPFIFVPSSRLWRSLFPCSPARYASCCGGLHHDA